MIPIELSLTNFFSYREPSRINFQALHLAAITGANGAGKSTILDAMTWALFGKCRVRSDDDVVNRKAARRDGTAEVAFSFDIDGALYRVVRRKRVGRTAELEFQLSTGENAEGERQWKAMTEAKLRETQLAIETLLRMNYDVFTNASFILQGQADEFTTKTADKRKEVLAEILNVTVWDTYRLGATERRREAENDHTGVKQQLALVEAELAEAPQRRAALEAAVAAEAEAMNRRDAQMALVENARQVQSVVEQRRRDQVNMANDLAAVRNELIDIERRQERQAAQLAQLQVLLDSAGQIRANHDAWQKNEAQLHRWQDLADQRGRLEAEKRPHEAALAEARASLTHEVRTLEERAARLESSADDISALDAAVTEARASIAVLDVEIAALSKQTEEWQSARGKLQQLEAVRSLWNQERTQLAEQLRAVERQSAERAQADTALQSAMQALESAQETVSRLQQQRQEYALAIADHDRAQAETVRLRAEMVKKRERMDQLKAAESSKCPLCGQPLTDEHKTKVLAQLQAEGTAERQRYDEQVTLAAASEARSKQLAGESAKLDGAERERVALEKRVLDARGRAEEIARTLEHWEQSGRPARLSELEGLLADSSEADRVREEIDSLAETAGRKQAAEASRQALREQLSADEVRLTALRVDLSDWQQAGAPRLAEARSLLAGEEFAQDTRAALAEFEQRIAAVGYDPEQHQSCRARRADLSTAVERYQELLRAEAAVGPLKESLSELVQRQRALLARQAELQERAAAMAEELATLESGLGDVAALEARLQQLREKVIETSQGVGAARQHVEVLEQQRQRQTKLQADAKALQRALGRYRQLEEAFGRRGIQAWLIETALPDIQQRANDLLDRLSGGGMYIEFRTQREAKSSDKLIETLEINISDGLGERPYDNYSGGEKFRINFAIRLALSHVLAHRAGTRLQTLVIDEGFGSQDPEGRQRLVEAINAVESDFACVLVITHIDELRDAFPARIEVDKTPAGSQATVVTV